MPRDLKTTDEDVFKFIYLLGLHTPRSVTKNLERAPDSSVSPDDAAVAVNKIVNEYLKVLKENDVYDNSEIIFMADHGLSEHAGKRFPLLLYKPANQSGTGITISNAPISYDDMFPTLVKLSGGEPTARTIFDIGEDEERVRYFGMDNKEFYGHVKNSE
ncbi:MAG: sulfatase-like hydrolase/transferase [Oscillospiraceae bacterium]|nr:sulfatase-like hydrolase/transferase [Oscillospiraceae bacterium]